MAVVTPEDSVLSKLEWAKRSGDAERQLRDIAGVLEMNPGLGRACIERWADALGVADVWKRVEE